MHILMHGYKSLLIWIVSREITIFLIDFFVNGHKTLWTYLVPERFVGPRLQQSCHNFRMTSINRDMHARVHALLKRIFMHLLRNWSSSIRISFYRILEVQMSVNRCKEFHRFSLPIMTCCMKTRFPALILLIQMNSVRH